MVPLRALIRTVGWLLWMIKNISLWEARIYPEAMEAEGWMDFSDVGVTNLLL